MRQGRVNLLIHQIYKLAGRGGDGPGQDGEVLGRFVRERDTVSFEELLRRHGPMVWHVCWRVLSHPQDAEDAFQATFFYLACHAGSIRNRDAVGAWLHGVAYRVALKARRSSARQTPVAEFPDGPPAADAGDEVSRREVRRVIDEELGGLSEKYRAPLVLCLLEDRPQEEAARHLGLSLSTLKRRLRQGRDLLRTRLSRRGLAVPAGLSAALLLPGKATAVVPAALMQGTLRTGFLLLASPGRELLPSNVALLMQGAGRSALAPAGKLAVAGVLLAAGLLGTGLAAHFAQSPSGSAVRQTVRLAAGTVRNPESPVDVNRTVLPSAHVVLKGHKGAVRALAISGNGKYLASMDQEHGVKVWDIFEAKEVFDIQGAGGRIPQSLAISPDGKVAASAAEAYGAGLVEVWDTKARKKLWQTEGVMQGFATQLTFGPDGSELASSRTIFDQERLLQFTRWDSRTGKVKGEGAVRGVVPTEGHSVLSADGRRSVAQVEDGLTVWDTATGRPVCAVPVRMRGVGGYALAPVALGADGAVLTVVDETNKIQVWAVAGDRAGGATGAGPEQAGGGPAAPVGKRLATFAAPGEGVEWALPSPDGRTVAANTTGGVVFWEVAGGGMLGRAAVLEKADAKTRRLVFSPDGGVIAVAGGGDGDIHLFELKSLLSRPAPGDDGPSPAGPTP